MSKLFLPFALIFFLTAGPVKAGDIDYVELQSRNTKYHVDYVLRDDFTVEQIFEIRVKVLTDKAAKDLKKRQFSHSTSIEKFEVLEAYTLKTDGTRIPVPEGNFQVTINKGKDDAAAVFSDRTSVTVVFPDLEINDSIYIRIRNTETEPMFPGNFSESGYFWSQAAFDDVKVTFDLPEDLNFRDQVRGMTETRTIRDGRLKIVLTYKSEKPIRDKRSNYSVWDASQEAGYVLSTFQDYESVAQAYGERALPKSIPTDRVRFLAQEIVGMEEGKREQARLLYDWVATNISYAGNCIGVGAVVPHDIDFILDNRMGDCKDHATLLEALCTAVDIETSQALINSGSIYELPEVPTVESVNHVITYFPEWDKFVDSTSHDLPFDSLGIRISDKPVLLVENYIEGKKTPPTQPGENRQEIDSVMRIQPDGSVTGELHISAQGQPAIQTRTGWRYATPEQQSDWLEKTFSSNNSIGSATMTNDDPVPLLSDFNYSFEFDKPDFILPSGAGGFYIAPLVGTAKPVGAYVSYSKEDIGDYDITCSNGYAVERLVYEFPESIKILAKPDDFEIDENYLSYRATYQLEGNRLQVLREIDDRTPGNVCSSDLINRQRQTMIKISKNLSAQVVYQHQ